MVLKVARRAAIAPFFVMEVMRAAAEREQAGGDVLHLEVGQPASSAPAGVRAAAAAALADDRLGYVEALGLPALRAAIARHYRDRHRLDVPARRVVVTTGSSGGFVLAFLAAFEAGDRVAMVAPGYPCYRNILAALGVEPVVIPVGPETGYQLTPALLEAAGPLDGLIIASPANPTGTMIDREDLEDLSDYCVARGIRLISDEIYHGIGFGKTAVSALDVTDDAIVVNSFSKYFCMTGWRLGWLVVPEPLLRPIECLAQNLFISAPTLSQLAACAAFDCKDELNRHVARYADNRALLLEHLPKAGFGPMAPADGAFYLYADISALTDDSEAWCRTLLAETGVAITPGIDFDPVRGRRFVRISFSGATDTIAEAVRRLRARVG